MSVSIDYRREQQLDTGAVQRVLRASGINRPVEDAARITRMFAGANLVFGAWHGDTLVGVCRALTDFSYCCYLSDLAVDAAYQQQGIGRGLVQCVQQAIGEEVALILIAAPAALDYYPALGFEPLANGYIIRRAR